MNKQLTLNIDKEIVEQAKLYAQKKHQSLSYLVEEYFRFLVDTEKKQKRDLEISPTVCELSGIIHLEDDFDFHDNYTDYLVKKYR